jgi:Putative Flp pilus-assembly TadE/G-like
MHRWSPRAAESERGQVVVIVAVAFTIILMFLAVVFDGGSALVRRRQLQDASDAAALAAANAIHVGAPRGCSGDPLVTTPRASVAQAARDSLAANLPWFDANTAVVSCTPGYDDWAVTVQVDTVAPQFFGGLIGDPMNVHSRSVAVNGQIRGSTYAIIQLDPHNPSWPNGRRGCPSILLSGGPSVTLQGTIHANSACSAANGGALATNGNASTLTMQNGAQIRLVGGYAPAALTISPPPVTGVAPIKDPLAGLPPMDTSGMTVRSSVRLVLNNQTMLLEPGIYRGGIQLRNSSIAYLRPGIFVFEGGGLDIGAQASVFSVAAGVSSTNAASWTTDCPDATCGVLLFNDAGASTPMGQVAIGAGATLKLRAYEPDALAGAGVTDYENILLWQDATPVPTSSYAQPEVALSGGGSVTISGTVYAPSAKVTMGGGSGGSGGSTNLTLQFISWDLEFRGNSSFVFNFNDEDFARPTNYGLIE